MSKDLVEHAIDSILESISSGRFKEERPLPPESELANLLGVSRLTMREAVQVLKDRGVLEVIHGRGTYINPISQWQDLSAVAAFLSHQKNPFDLGYQLLEVRRMIEVGACALASQRCSEADLSAMADDLRRFDEADAVGDVTAVAQADMAFHQHIHTASGNPFIGTIMMPLQKALAVSRTATSADVSVRRRAQQHHKKIYRAISARDAAAAEAAMQAHMTQTAEDLASLRVQK